MAENNYINEMKRFNQEYGIEFSLEKYLEFQAKTRRLNNFLFEINQPNNRATIYVNALEKALLSYMESKTKMEYNKTYNLSNLPLDKFVEDFDKVMHEKYLSELDDNKRPSRKPHAGIKREDLVTVLRDRLKSFDQPLSDIWADSMVNKTLSLEKLKEFTQGSIAKVDDVHVEYLDDNRRKHLSNVVMAKQALEKAISKRTIGTYLWIGNWRRIYRENRYFETLTDKLNEYNNHQYPIDQIIEENSKSVLASSNEKLENLKKPPKTEAELNEEAQRLSAELREKETALNAEYAINESQDPEVIPEGVYLVDKNLLKVGFIPKPDTLQKDYEELLKIQKHLNTFSSENFYVYTSENGDSINYLTYLSINKIVEHNIKKLSELISIKKPEELNKMILKLSDEKTPDGWHNRNQSLIEELANLKEVVASELLNVEENKINDEEYVVDSETAEKIETEHIKNQLSSTYQHVTEEEMAEFRKQLKAVKFAEQIVKETETSKKIAALNERYANQDPEFFQELEIPNLFLKNANYEERNNDNFNILNEEQIIINNNPIPQNELNASNVSDSYEKEEKNDPLNDSADSSDDDDDFEDEEIEESKIKEPLQINEEDLYKNVNNSLGAVDITKKIVSSKDFHRTYTNEFETILNQISSIMPIDKGSILPKQNRYEHVYKQLITQLGEDALKISQDYDSLKDKNASKSEITKLIKAGAGTMFTNAFKNLTNMNLPVKTQIAFAQIITDRFMKAATPVCLDEIEYAKHSDNYALKDNSILMNALSELSVATGNPSILKEADDIIADVREAMLEDDGDELENSVISEESFINEDDKDEVQSFIYDSDDEEKDMSVQIKN